MNKYIYLFLMIAFTLTAPIQAINSYKLIDMGLDDTEGSHAVAINDKCQVAGTYSKNGKIYCFLWEKKKGLSLLDVPPTARPKIINNAGQVAGQFHENTGTRGFLWDPQLGLFDLGTLGGTQTFVFGMNDLGQIVGHSYTKDDAERHAFIWQNGIMTDLGVLKSTTGVRGTFSEARSINNQGQIIGNATRSILFKNQLVQSNQRAVIWRNMQIEELDPNLEGQMHIGSINDKGQLICLKYPRDPELPRGLFVIDLNSKKATPIGDGMGGIPSIDDRGNLLFGSGVMFAQNKKSKQKSYEKLLFSTLFRKIAREPWNEMLQAVGMNKKNWVVGSATDISGKTHAVILVPITDKIFGVCANALVSERSLDML